MFSFVVSTFVVSTFSRRRGLILCVCCCICIFCFNVCFGFLCVVIVSVDWCDVCCGVYIVFVCVVVVLCMICVKCLCGDKLNSVDVDVLVCVFVCVFDDIEFLF